MLVVDHLSTRIGLVGISSEPVDKLIVSILLIGKILSGVGVEALMRLGAEGKYGKKACNRLSVQALKLGLRENLNTNPDC